MAATTHPIQRILNILRFERQEIIAIYFYSLLSGLLQLSVPLGIQAVISFVLGGAVSTSLVLLIGFIILSVLLTGILQVNQMKLIEKTQQKLLVRYAMQYTHLLPHVDLRETNAFYLPELVNRFFDAVALQKGIAKLLLDIPLASIQVIFGLILLSLYHPVFILFGVLLLVVLVIIIRFTGKKGLSTSIEESDYKYGVAGSLEELARSVVAFKFAKNPALHIGKADGLVTSYLNTRTRHFKILLAQYWILIVFKLLITASMLIIGVVLLLDQQINLGQFIAAEIVILMVIASVEKLIVNLDNVYDVLTSVEKLAKLTDKPVEKNGTVLLPPATQQVSLRVNGLGFGYSNEKKVLRNISFSVEPGEKLCVMGSLASGKTTLLRVLSGTFAPFDGEVLLAGNSLEAFDKPTLRRRIGMFAEEQLVFQGTIRENLTMGDNNITDEEILRACQLVGLPFDARDGFVALEQTVEPAGHHLSGRFERKLMLARSILGNPVLLLMEEPFLGLTEEEHARMLHFIMHECKATAVIVTNDPDVAREADKIIILEHGTLKASGTPDELQNLL